MNESSNGSQTDETNYSAVYPPKPVLIEKSQNALLKSLINLVVFGVLFYFLFDRNISAIAAILVVVIIHEMGHFLFMKLFNYNNVKIFIVPLLGAFTTGKKQVVSQWQLSVIILAGPLPGIIIGLFLFWYNLSLQNEMLEMLSSMFLIINLFNCLPFHPLDGGRLVETLFFKENFMIRLIFGIISVLVLLFIFIAFQNLIMIIVPVLIARELYNENKNQKIREYLRLEKINYHSDYENLPDKNYWLIRDCLIFSFPKKYASMQPGVYEYNIAEPLVIQHINSVLQIDLKLDLNLFKRILVLLFYIAMLVGPLIFILLHIKLPGAH